MQKPSVPCLSFAFQAYGEASLADRLLIRTCSAIHSPRSLSYPRLARPGCGPGVRECLDRDVWCLRAALPDNCARAHA